MAKENMQPYVVKLGVSLENIEKVPENMTPEEIFMTITIGAIISYGKQKGGLAMPDHSRLKRIRDDMANAVKVKDETVSIDFEDFKFLMKCWNAHTPDPQSNELVMRVWDVLKEAQKEHDEPSQIVT
jgi:hypothetical protein